MGVSMLDKKDTFPKNVAPTDGLSDKDMDDLISCMWENIDCLPCYVQDVLKKSNETSQEGIISSALAEGWITGKFEWSYSDPLIGGKHGWVSSKNNVN